MRFLFLSILITIFYTSCQPGKQQQQPVDYYSSLPLDYQEVLRAHGGLEKWKAFRTLEYDLQHQNDSLPTEHYILDLASRKDLTVADSFKIGFDGKEVWVAPNRAAYKGRSARFYHNLYSYFLTIPFIVSDPGANYSIDTLTLDGKLYDAIKVTFNEGVGDADDDYYQMLVDPQTHRMENSFTPLRTTLARRTKTIMPLATRISLM